MLKQAKRESFPSRALFRTQQRSGFESVQKQETCSHCHIVSAI